MKKPVSLRAEVLAGITTSFALVPECIAFALVAQLNPLMGLYGAFIICTFTALMGGRPGMVSGAAGSMAVVIVSLVVQHGAQYFLATVVLSGALMMLFGLLRLGQLVRMVPHPVMLGFVNGLAVVIALSQLEHFKHGGAWLQGAALYWMLGLVALTVAVVVWLPRLTRVVPPALVAIVGVGGLTWSLALPTATLGDMAHMAGGWPTLAWPDVPLNWHTLAVIAPYAGLMAMVGLLETLLTLNLTDEITQSRGHTNRECVALGMANVGAGLAGGMGGCAMIGQTMINLNSGGRGRVSGVVAGVMVLLFVLYLSPLIEQIPLAALVGVMLVVAQQTFAWASLRVVNKVPASDAVVIVLVTLITVWTDLATAVLCGVVIAALNFAWQHARQLYVDVHTEPDGSKVYRAHGTLFFASTTQFLSLFDPAHDPGHVTLDCQHLSFVDYSAIEAMHTLRQRYQRAGKHLRVIHLSDRCKQLLRRAGAAGL
jgi:sulfate permease, SulP family